MNTPNGDLGAYPSEQPPYQPGITKREHFAAMAMQGLISDSTYRNSCADTALTAVCYADALIAALNQNKALMNCHRCQNPVSQGPLHRTNPVGEEGIFCCLKCLTSEERVTLDPETADICRIIHNDSPSVEGGSP